MSRIALVLSACLLAAFGGVASAQPAVSPSSTEPALVPPGPPNALAAVAYSQTAGALRWERGRSNRLVSGYEITRDGQVLGVVDALSYVERSLLPGTSYRYRVVAIDIEGLRSGAGVRHVRHAGHTARAVDGDTVDSARPAERARRRPLQLDGRRSALGASAAPTAWSEGTKSPATGASSASSTHAPTSSARCSPARATATASSRSTSRGCARNRRPSR